MIFNCEAKNKEAIALINEHGKKYSYADICSFQNEWKKQIPTRCLTLIFAENSFPALAAYIASIDSAIVPLMLDIAKTLDSQDLIDNYKPAYIWLPSEYANNFNHTIIWEFENYSLLKTDFEPYDLYKDLALLVTSSGSTGSSKLIRQSYNNILSNTKSIIEYLEIDSTERPITSLPLNYVYGLSVVNTHISAGATILLTTKGILQKEFWDFFKEYQATSLAGVPYHYEMLKRLRFFRMDLPSLRTLTQAGGKLAPALHQEFATYAKGQNKRFYVMYGSAEATARMGYLPFEKALEKSGAMGIAIPYGNLYLCDDEGNEIKETDKAYELYYKGDNVTLGYSHCADDLAKGDENKGVLATGDIATRDDEGFYTIVGRKNRFLKLFGNRISLDVCQRLIEAEFSIECACVGKDDAMMIYCVGACDAQEVRKFIAEKTKIHFSAFKVLSIEALPRNASGKTLYSELPNE